ncbi:MAG: protein kinase [Spirochaetales bacterium]|nr:protein kinase [Leptospiraceae bacterium]MCP5480817.1 protein kinase [Spirochaetales bacterium]
MHVQLTERALAGDKWSIARLISLFEDPRPSAAEQRALVLASLRQDDRSRRAVFPGITGTPGSGKSTLLGRLALLLIQQDPEVRVAVVAIDPSSHVSGGSILGDRTRVQFPLDELRLFFRSQASDLELGGVSRTTFQVCRLLYFLFDFVFIETVGIGQNEIEIQHVADRIYLVLQPLGGDQVQFMKAGIMEIPDAFVLNKSDTGLAADQSFHALKASLSFSRPGEEDRIPIFRTSATTGSGVQELSADIVAADRKDFRRTMNEKEAYFFEKWVRDEYGRTGLRFLNQMRPGASAYLKKAGSFDEAQMQFHGEYRGQP